MRRTWMAGISGIVVMLVVAATAIIASSGVPLRSAAAVPTPADDAGAVRELAQRLLTPAYPGPDGQVATVALLPGQLPGDLPLALPPPPNGRLVGRAVHQSGARSVSWDVVFDAPGAASDEQAFYHQQLPGLGWVAAPVNQRPMRGGFQSTTGINSTYCQKATGPWLSVSAVATPTVPTDVRIRVDASTPGPCANQPGAASQQPPGAERLPALPAPADVQIQMNGGGGGPNRFNSDATAITAQSASALETYFAQQLAAAGWTRVADDAAGPLAWSIWTVPGDGGYQGFLYALDAPGQNRKELHVQVESATASFGGGASSPTIAMPSGGVVPATTAPMAPVAPLPPGVAPTRVAPALPSPTATPAR